MQQPPQVEGGPWERWRRSDRDLREHGDHSRLRDDGAEPAGLRVITHGQRWADATHDLGEPRLDPLVQNRGDARGQQSDHVKVRLRSGSEGRVFDPWQDRLHVRRRHGAGKLEAGKVGDCHRPRGRCTTIKLWDLDVDILVRGYLDCPVEPLPG